MDSTVTANRFSIIQKLYPQKPLMPVTYWGTLNAEAAIVQEFKERASAN